MKKNLQSDFNTRQYMLSQDFEIYYYNDTNFTGEFSNKFSNDLWYSTNYNKQLYITGKLL